MGDSRWAGGIFPLREYRIARDELLAWKRAEFPIPCVVKVDSPFFSGVGVVVASGGSYFPADLLTVRRECRISFNHPLEHCTRITDESLWPKWVRDEMEGRK